MEYGIAVLLERQPLAVGETNPPLLRLDALHHRAIPWPRIIATVCRAHIRRRAVEHPRAPIL